MYKRYSVIILSILMISLFVIGITPVHTTQAASSKLANGTYTLKYDVLKAENNSVSMANDYFEKPAKLYVKNGKMTMQVQLNHSEWTTQFKVKYKGKIVDTKVIQSNSKKDTRIVQFPIADLKNPIISKIHVTVSSYNYDHDYTIRLALDQKSIKAIKK